MSWYNIDWDGNGVCDWKDDFLFLNMLNFQLEEEERLDRERRIDKVVKAITRDGVDKHIGNEEFEQICIDEHLNINDFDQSDIDEIQRRLDLW